MTTLQPRLAVATIPAALPFLDTLAARLHAEAGGDPLALSRAIVLLPTRRACRALSEAFLRLSDGKPLLLPRLVPVGDIDVEEIAFHADEAMTGAGEGELPPAIPDLQRRLLLARLIQKRDPRLLPGQAALLARALARFLDEAQTEGADFAGLAALVPADLAQHWQDVLRFLGIVTENWPAILKERGALDPAEWRNRALARQAAAWRANPPVGRILAAGLTGGVPAVAELMTVVAGLPGGTVVLPGLERDTPEEVWAAIREDAGHPQHLFARFLDRLELPPQAVEVWRAPGFAEGPAARGALIAEALLPAPLTERWRSGAAPAPEALDGLRRLDCAGPQEEAQTIALLLRQSLETPQRTAALVTPDRDLARRVAAELLRWGVEIDDSAGVPLDQTPPGVFLRLVLELVAEAAAPVALLAALKHPLAACGLAAEEFRARLRFLERTTLRGVRPAPGFAGLTEALKPDAAGERDLIARIERRLKPLAAAMAKKRVSLAKLAAAHVAAAEALAESDAEPGAGRLWRGEAGEAASEFIADLLAAAEGHPPLRGADYPALFASLIAGRMVRPRYGRHPRLAIWGLLEARLQRADLTILGGLNEGTWPPNPAEDPWMSRPMRQGFGIAPPERRVGLAAHDFTQAACGPEVVLTRAARVGGAPTLPSRWLLRLQTVLRAHGLAGALTRETGVLAWQSRLDRPEAPRILIDPPAPRPSVEVRPRTLSVTEIETWMRDPYAIYARRVLDLEALEPLDAEPAARERGIFIHRVLDGFIREFPGPLPPDDRALARLMELGRVALGELWSRPGVWAFWWPRFERIARWFLAQERDRRRGIVRAVSELRGDHRIAGPAGEFILRARADRIDVGSDGGLTVIDYKTGRVPPGKAVEQGLAPQLPLEAAIAAAGGFAGLPAGTVHELAYWKLSGSNPAGEIKTIAEGADAQALAAAARAGLEALIARFDDRATPYRAVPVASRAPDYSDYVHLERVKEWRAGGKDDE